jgi:hypothetical protein
MKRKIIQITVWSPGYEGPLAYLIALCDDGSIWRHLRKPGAKETEREWVQMELPEALAPATR